MRRYFSESGVEVLPSVWKMARRFRESMAAVDRPDEDPVAKLKEDLAQLDEALTATSQAQLTRRGSKRIGVYNSEGKLVRTRLVGAPDASRTVGRITEPEVPLDAVRSDLERKLRLRSVMPRHEDEITRPMRAGILDELMGDDDDQVCHDRDGNEVPCDDPAAVDADETEIPPQVAYIGRVAKSPNRRESATKTFTENYYGMSGDDGPPSEKPQSMSDLHGSELAAALAEENIQLSKADAEVNFRSAQASPPVPGASCEKCKWFDGDSGSCAVVSGLIARQTVSDLYSPKSAAEKAFTDEYETKQ